MDTFRATPNRYWHPDPSVNLGSSLPVRTVTGQDDPDFKPPPLLGFAPTRPTTQDPLLWEGDNT